MQTAATQTTITAKATFRYAAVSLAYVLTTIALGVTGRIPLENPDIQLRPQLALASVFLILFGWTYLPVAFVAMLIESARTPILGGNAGFVACDAILSTGVAAMVAYCVRHYSRPGKWGSQRDFALLGACCTLLPLVLAAVELFFPHQASSTHPFFWVWMSAVFPLAAIVPAGIKIGEWLRDDPRPALPEYLGAGVKPGIQLAQCGLLLVSAGLLWVEKYFGGNGRTYPLLIVCFWIALTSGLPGASIAVVLAQACIITLNHFFPPKNTSLFDLLLATAVMGSAAVVAGGLVSARKLVEARLREQGRVLRRQLAEIQVIRRLADAIIALQDDVALYQLGAESIGEQLHADQVWLLWVSESGEVAEDRGFWSSIHSERDRFGPNLCGEAFAPVWRDLEQSRRPLVSHAELPNAELVEAGLDFQLHSASGAKSLIFHPFSFEGSGFYVAAILNYSRERHWTDEELAFVTAVVDQITIAIQKTKLLGEREERSRAFSRMTQALVTDTGDSFYRNLVARLAEAADARGAYCARIEPSGREARMIAYSDSGKSRKEFSFEVNGTPMAVASEKGMQAIEDQAGEAFPRLKDITGVEIRGFASASLVDSQGVLLGSLAIYDDKPLADPGHIASVLRLFAARASTEIERSERERLLRESEASQRRLLETAHEGIWVIDAEGKITFVNAMMASMLGYSVDEMLGKHLQEYVDQGDQERVSMELHRELAGTAAQQDLRFRRRDGTFMWTMLSMSPIRGDEGEFQGALAMVTDISERKQTEQDLDRLVRDRTNELVNSNRELEAFCYSISHDLRQPLRAIDGFSRAAVEDLGDDISADVKDDLNRVRRAANKMSELIDALLALSRLSRMEMKRETVDLSEIAERILSELARTEPNRAKGYSVRKGLTVVGDARLLYILMENLLSNAWKFSAKSKEPFVEFGSKAIGGQPWLYVKDNGIGFDMAYKSKLFQPFERLHSESDFQGTGIGLATVSRIISRHNGRIEAESEVGKGATFYFTL